MKRANAFFPLVLIIMFIDISLDHNLKTLTLLTKVNYEYNLLNELMNEVNICCS